jgi:UDP-2,3-diacylglucosamine hydrolase
MTDAYNNMGDGRHGGAACFAVAPGAIVRLGSLMAQVLDTIGIIAGNRSLPLVFARQARALGVKRLVAVAFENETSPELAALVDDIVWLKVGQLSKMISAFKERGVACCVMVGQVAPRNLFDLRPDFRALALLMKLKEKNAHSIFGALAEELKKDGVELVEPVRWLRPLMPDAGFCLGPALSVEQKADVALGLRIAKEVSRLEIGQTVVVKEGTVLAVEGLEGTDDCLRRGGALAGSSGGAVAVKVAKDKHDLRFDIPCIGSGTLETCREAKIAAFAFESGKTLLMDREAVEALAKKFKISVAAC